jgi:LysR family nitrogen assimilation transcriptional regulator
VDSRIDLITLRIVLTVADCGSYSRAAQMLGITQPAVSRRVVSLEQELRSKLFRRDGHRFVPTEVGQSVCDYARQIIKLVDELPTSAQELIHQPSGQLSIGMAGRLGELVLPRVIPAYQKAYPRVFLRIEEGGADMSDLIVNGRIDLGLMYGKPVSSMVELLPLVENELGLLLPKAWQKHAPNGKPLPKRMTLRDAAELPLLVPNQTQGYRHLIEDTFHAAGLEPAIAMEVSSMGFTRVLIGAGLGYAFLLRAAIRGPMDTANMFFAPIHDTVIKWPLSIAINKRLRPNLAAKLMISMIEATMRDLVNENVWPGKMIAEGSSS